MKTYYIQPEEFKNFETIDGRLQCPSGDYQLISRFPEKCSFGEGCSFGERCSFGKGCSFGERCSFGKGCSFGEWCSFGESCSFGKSCSYNGHKLFEDPLFSVGYIGSERRTTYAFASIHDGVRICCGCQGDLSLKKFEKQVKDTHKNNEQYRDEYLAAINLIKIWSKRFYRERSE